MKRDDFIALAMIQLCGVQSVEYGDSATPEHRFLSPDEALRRANRFWKEYEETMSVAEDHVLATGKAIQQKLAEEFNGARDFEMLAVYVAGLTGAPAAPCLQPGKPKR